jgi:hypothetical protein
VILGGRTNGASFCVVESRRSDDADVVSTPESADHCRGFDFERLDDFLELKKFSRFLLF